VIADDHPLALGVVGANGGVPETREVVDSADLVLFVGCRAGSITTERWRHPVPGNIEVVHIDADESVIGVNYPTAAALVGDARLALDALVRELGTQVPARDGWGRVAVARAKESKRAAFRALARSNETPIRPERLVAELQAVLPEDAVVVADPGTPCPYLSAYYELRRAGRHLISNRAHGALGFALPGSIGAHYGRPGAKCVAVVGDGSFGMAAGELETMVRLELPITVVVVSNGTFGWIKAGQKTGFGARYFSVDFGRSDHAGIARAFGLEAWRVERPDELRPALAAAVARDGPTLVDVITQPLHEARAPVSEWVA
ncbi:MAG: thiamine pyrophosphate-binding protein, partial [Alphaproteobacteria bacterium]